MNQPRKERRMRVIYKYPLEIIGEQKISLPEDFDVLKIGEQRGNLMLWASGDNTLPDISVTLYIIGTGHPMPEGVLSHMDSVLMSNGLVWHVYWGKYD